jgi:hypothetical protein
LALLSPLLILHLYFGVVDFAAAGRAAPALALYPVHTEMLEWEMMHADTLAEAMPFAERLAARNDYAFLALDTLARGGLADGDPKGALELKLQSLAVNRFLAADYLELLDICVLGRDMAVAADNRENAEYFTARAREIPEMMAEARRAIGVSYYRLELPPEALACIEAMQ